MSIFENYTIHIEDESALYGDARNPTKSVADIKVEGHDEEALAALAETIYQAVKKKYNSSDFALTMYITEREMVMSKVVKERPIGDYNREEARKRGTLDED